VEHLEYAEKLRMTLGHLQHLHHAARELGEEDQFLFEVQSRLPVAGMNVMASSASVPIEIEGMSMDLESFAQAMDSEADRLDAFRQAATQLDVEHPMGSDYLYFSANALREYAEAAREKLRGFEEMEQIMKMQQGGPDSMLESAEIPAQSETADWSSKFGRHKKSHQEF